MPPPAEADVLDALRPILDPELAVSIVDLGLIYGVGVTPEGDVEITYTLTTRGCPMGRSITEGMERVLTALPGVRRAECRLVWDPAWNVGMINAEGRRRLGMG